MFRRRWRRALLAAWLVGAASTAAPSWASAFADVDEGEWFSDAIDWMATEGITTGISPGCFAPGHPVSRAQAATFLHRLAGSPPAAAPLRFADVTADWQLDAVAWMAEGGITTGIGPFTFAPDRPVTRGQFATFLHRYAGRPPAPPHPFGDVTESWQQAAVSWMVDAGITTGIGPDTFGPELVVSRAQAATFLHRFAGGPAVDIGADAGADDPRQCRHRIVIHATGDVNFDPGYGPFPERPFFDAWTDVDHLFLADGLTIVNLECTPSVLGAVVPKTFNFRCPLGALPAMRDGGIDVANLANNHGADYGIEALLDGVRNVERVGVATTGVGADAAEAARGLVIERNGWRIAVLGFNTIGSRALAGPGRAGMAGGSIDAMTDAVRAAAEESDLVLVTIHWGVEGTFTPTAADTALGRALIDAGADAVFGHHPHRLQPLEFHNGKPIFWSLGNFVWQLQERSKHTGIGRIIVDPDGSIEAGIIPAVIERKGHPAPA